ncbi:hypothetical protein T07_15205 [Trichinella nelsoni]|uniref:Uncharacterized protein n=1 Tax=Trichinella nelsoni TaxID=6336 RepID=A0A0V0RTD7_9BILA|nr:hypothetical protein T07_15205 [Trichinella nelsoni]
MPHSKMYQRQVLFATCSQICAYHHSNIWKVWKTVEAEKAALLSRCTVSIRDCSNSESFIVRAQKSVRFCCGDVRIY